MHLQDQIFLERMSSSKEVRIGTSQNNSSNLLETFALRLDLDFRWDSKAWNSKTQKGYSSILLVDMGGLYNTPSKRFFQREVASVKKKLSLPIKHLFQRVFLSFFRAKIIYLTKTKRLQVFSKFLRQKTCWAILWLNFGSGKNVMHGFHVLFLTLNTLGTKSFAASTNFLICSVHNSVIQNTTFFNIFHVSLPCDTKYLESKDEDHDPIFFGKPTSNRFKTHT